MKNKIIHVSLLMTNRATNAIRRNSTFQIVAIIVIRKWKLYKEFFLMTWMNMYVWIVTSLVLSPCVIALYGLFGKLLNVALFPWLLFMKDNEINILFKLPCLLTY